MFKMAVLMIIINLILIAILMDAHQIPMKYLTKNVNQN